ncbi:putative membrane protein [Nitrobacter winogradskyi Nb-255]|uniref:Putative membrane protein n=1 Tax=Nitrobacter winogradskyi (strain ATCC 25391 / DSM 10237 / CIP 104748 / NCIMB 11846 / Nb-255) TaxID=323098 RepID=Q3SMY4_NITWN|nr:type II toxin-antitoxin system HigB family toxin [Nitrobacter winogradskyi]ABA06357.1 putative membrane protein [Nitrobacter winogradskyi Nb-255]
MLVIGTDIVEQYFAERSGHRGIDAARSQYRAWLAIAGASDWRTPQDVKRSHPKASILKGGRVVFNIKANDFRLIALMQYRDGVVMIRFFGSHEEYDKVNAETV